MEFKDNFPDYETIAQHDAAAGVEVRKKLMFVFWLLLVVTLVEVAIGWFWHDIHHNLHVSKTWLIITFVAFTLFKAGYIVMVFMHLGDENKWMRWTILGPYSAFVVYFIYMLSIGEGAYSGLEGHRNLLDPVKEAPAPAPAHH